MATPGPKRRRLADRLWEKVDRTGGEDACWPFTGGKTTLGYGVISPPGESHGKRGYYAHVVAYCDHRDLDIEEFRKERGRVKRTCEDRSCCNPKHLTGTTFSWMGKTRRSKYEPLNEKEAA